MLRGGRAQRGYDESMGDDDVDFGELDSKEGNKTDDDDYGVADSKVCNKTRVNGSFNSPLSQAPKRLFQREEQVISLPGVSSRKVGQRDIRELFPQAQGPARGQVSSPQDQGGMSRESRDQPGKPKDDASYGPVRRGKEITWSGSTNLHLAESIDNSRADSLEIDSVIDGFEMHPLDPESTLPFLISGSQTPKTAILAFKYCGVKNKRIVRNSSQSLANPPQKNLQRHNDDEEFTPSTSVQAVIRVRGRENVKTACDSISWDMS